MDILTDYPERLKKGKRVYVGEQHAEMKIEATRPHKDLLLVQFDQISTVAEAENCRNQVVFVSADELPMLPAGEHYRHQLIGLKAINALDGAWLGVVTDVMETGANDVYVITTEEGKELLLPAVAPFVQRVDIDGNILHVTISQEDKASLLNAE